MQGIRIRDYVTRERRTHHVEAATASFNAGGKGCTRYRRFENVLLFVINPDFGDNAVRFERLQFIAWIWCRWSVMEIWDLRREGARHSSVSVESNEGGWNHQAQ